MVPFLQTARPSPLGLPGCLLPLSQLQHLRQGSARPPAAPSLPEPPRYKVCSSAGGFQVIWETREGGTAASPACCSSAGGLGTRLPPFYSATPLLPPQCHCLRPRCAHSGDRKARGAGGVQQRRNSNTGVEPHGGAASRPPRGARRTGTQVLAERMPPPRSAPAGAPWVKALKMKPLQGAAGPHTRRRGCGPQTRCSTHLPNPPSPADGLEPPRGWRWMKEAWPSKEVGRSCSRRRCWGRGGEMKDAGSELLSIEQKAREGEACTEEPQDRPCPSNSVLSSRSTSWRGCSCALITRPPPWFRGAGLKMVLELLEMKLDPESSREQGLSSHGQERREGAGLGPAEPRGTGEGVA